MPIDISTLTPQEQISSIYISYYNRAPDPLGLEFWTGQLDAGLSLEDIATTFSSAAETIGQFPFFDPDAAATSPDTFITSVYQNLFGRDPDAEGLTFWGDQLSSGSTPVGEIILAIAEGAQDVDGGTQDLSTLTNKVEVAADWAASAAAADIGTTEGSAIAVDNGDGTFTINNPDAFDSASTILDNVTEDPATVAAAEDDTAAFTGGETAAPTELGAALGALSDAQTAKTEFLEGLPGLDTDFDPATGNDGIDVEAGDAQASDVDDLFASASAAMQAETGVSDFANRSATVQDAAISEEQTSLEGAVNTATTIAEDGMTGLLNTLATREDQLPIAEDEAADAAADLADELAAFNSANSGVTGGVAAANQIEFVAAADYDPAADNSNAFLVIDGTIYAGEDGSTAAGPVALADIANSADVARGDVFKAAQDAAADANDAVQSAKDAIESTVEDIVLLETGAFSVKDLGGLFVPATGAVNLSATDAEVFRTEADANDDGTKAVYTIDLAGAATDGTTVETVEIGGVQVFTDGAAGDPALTDDGLATEIAGQTVTINTVDYAITAGGSATEVVLTAQTAEDVTANLTVTGPSTPPTATSFAPTTDGVAPVEPDMAGVPEAVDLADALEELSDFEDQAAGFETARDLNDQLAGLDDAIEAAGAALTNGENDDPAGLGVTLLEGADNFTAEDDVYLFNADDSAGVTLADFGAEGEDTIFFGDGFSLVEIPDGSGIGDNVGDVAALEILWEQDGNDLVLYVEAETFGGNSSGVGDVTEVTLTGVSATDITFGGGFLSAGADTVA